MKTRILIALAVLLLTSLACGFFTPSEPQIVEVTRIVEVPVPAPTVRPETPQQPAAAPAITGPACPLSQGQTSKDTALVNHAIQIFAEHQLRQIEGLPWPVTNPTELLKYFKITERDASEVEVDWDCITIQLPGVQIAGGYKTFHATNPMCSITFDGFKHAWQDDGRVFTGQAQIGFNPGTWVMEGISWFYKEQDNCSQQSPTTIAPACTPDSVAAQLGYPGISDVNSFLEFFQVKAIVGTINVVVEPDCRTLEIHVGNPDTDYFQVVNPFSHLDGFLWEVQPDHPEWSLSSGRTGIPNGTWLTQGITVWPGISQ